VRGILRGTTTGNLEKHVRDSHIDNWDRIRGALEDSYLMAAIRIRWEYSNRYVNEVLPPPPPLPLLREGGGGAGFPEVHLWCKQRGQYGGFDPHHHRHEIAVQVLEEQLWYTITLKSEEAMLSRFGSLSIWLNSKSATSPPLRPPPPLT
jgi:hypothetical protein